MSKSPYKYYTADIWKRQDIAWLIIGVLLAGIFIGVCIASIVVINTANAEDGIVYDVWVMCQPDSEVMIRQKPGKQARVIGAAGCGQKLHTDWKERDGWLHLIDLANETGEGWIHMGYVACVEPKAVNDWMTVAHCRRVAARKGIDGKRQAWVKSGKRVFVYMVADVWAVTDKGYIHLEYLEAGE